jgi:hypothetical protein
MSEELLSSDTDLSQSESTFDVLMSDTQTSDTFKRKSFGRHQENSVHDYFNYDSGNDISKCKIQNCEKQYKGKIATNLVKHLRTKHVNEYQSYLQNENQRKAKKQKSTEPTSSQPLITTFVSKSKVKKYDRNDPIAKGFRSRLVKLVSTTSVPISLVEKEEFRELIWFLNEKIPFPARKGLVNECLNYFNDSKREIISMIHNSDYISLGVDIWSKKGLSESYLGITGYFYDNCEQVKRVLTLGLKLFPHPHNAENIRSKLQSFILEYNIDYNKILRVITDNGSNMVRTFKLEWIEDKNTDDFDCDSEIEFNDDSDLDVLTQELDENEFDSEENELNSHFKTFKIERIGCFIHIIQCIIKISDKTNAFKSVLKSATKLIKRFRQSGNLTEKLKLISGSVLPTISITRWNSLYLQIRHLMSKKTEIIKICNEERIDSLSFKEWDLIKEYIDLFKPFDDITNEMSKEMETTISKVFSSIMFLKHHLNGYKTTDNESIRICAHAIDKELDKRFDHFFNPENEKFNEGIYIISTYLDPRFARLLNEKQNNYAKNYIKEFSKDIIETFGSHSEPETSTQTSEKLSAFESFMETTLSDLPERSMDNMLDLDKQLLNWNHFISKTRLSIKTEPLEFWRSDFSTEDFKDLKNIALNILCVPSSTATVERVFSAAGNACIGRRNRLSDKRLEMIVFFKNNAKYLKTLNFLK